MNFGIFSESLKKLQMRLAAVTVLDYKSSVHLLI